MNLLILDRKKYIPAPTHAPASTYQRLCPIAKTQAEFEKSRQQDQPEHKVIQCGSQAPAEKYTRNARRIS